MFGIELSAAELHGVDEYVALLVRWAARVNLIAARSVDEITDRHVLDSLALTQLARGVRVAADLGSGAGFPGVLMAITAPGTTLHLVEARERRAAFLREVVRTVGLRNVKVWPSRVETWQPPEPPELVAVRGLRPTVAAALARPLLVEGGELALMRKQGAGDLDATGYERVGSLRYSLPRGERHELAVLRRRT
jgi:16S rRNA (guanine527-N7)-methyltransferase